MGLYPGHCGLKYHQYILRNVEDNQYRLCKICLMKNWVKFLVEASVPPNKQFTLSPGRILDLIRNLNVIRRMIPAIYLNI